MKMDNRLIFKDGNAVMENPICFDLVHTFECGQCFRWNVNNGIYEGIVGGRYVSAKQEENKITFFDTDKEVFENVLNNYFDFDTDYAGIQKKLESDSVMKKAIPFGSGIRILRQDSFEALISFIISQNNNIPRIKLIIERFCKKFGKKIEAGGRCFYSFPTPEELSGIEAGDLSDIKAGFRDKYIADAVCKVNSGKVNLCDIAALSYEEAMTMLKQIKGVGDKVANCVLLFGMAKTEAFPIDVWIKRTVESLYKDEINGGDIAEFAKKRFGELGGFAQQYLFYYARENKLL